MDSLIARARAGHKFTTDDIKQLVEPLLDAMGSPVFKYNLDAIIAIVCKDRDGNGKFDVRDMEIMVSDPLVLASLVSAVVAMLGSIKKIRLSKPNVSFDDLASRTIAFIFLHAVPERTKLKLSHKDRLLLLEFMHIVHSSIMAGKMGQEAAGFLLNMVKSGTSACCGTPSKSVQLLEHTPNQINKFEKGYKAAHAVAQAKNKDAH